MVYSQENGINVLHIESRPSRRSNSEFEIFVDLEADRARVHDSIQQLKRQVSCVRFDLNNISELYNTLEQNADDGSVPNDNSDVDIPPPSPFLDKDGQPIKRKSKLIYQRRRKSNKKKRETTGYQLERMVPVEVQNDNNVNYF